MTMRLALIIAACAMLVWANAEQVHVMGHMRANEP